MQIICPNSDSSFVDEQCVTVILSGAGGFGKSTMALDLCHHYHRNDSFKNGIIFIDLGPQCCDPKILLSEHYCQMVKRDFEYFDDVENKIKELVKVHCNILVVIDDVWNVDDAWPIVNAFSYCKIILTTRNPNIDIPSKHKVEISSMLLHEARLLMISGIIEYDKLSKSGLEVVNKLVQSTHQWPLLISLIRGQLHHYVKQHNGIFKDEILLKIKNDLQNKGLTAFDKTKQYFRQHSVRACIEVSLGLLDKSTNDKLLSLILYTGIGGSLSSQVVHCIWDVSAEHAKKIVSSLEAYGLLHVKSLKQISQAANLTVHSVIGQYTLSTIKSEKMVYLSPFTSLPTEKVITAIEEILFDNSHMVDSSDKLEILSYNKKKLEQFVLPYYMKDINMYALHDPHVVVLILQSIQKILTDAGSNDILGKFNEQIASLCIECHNAYSNAMELSRKFNMCFQYCMRVKSFHSLIPILKEYQESKFIVSTIPRCVELAETISTQCDSELAVVLNRKWKDLKLLTSKYHPISLEKLARFQLYVDLHKKISGALNHKSKNEIEHLCDHITTGKFEKTVQLVQDNSSCEVKGLQQYGEFFIMHKVIYVGNVQV